LREVKKWLLKFVTVYETAEECGAAERDLFVHVASPSFQQQFGYEQSRKLHLWMMNSFFSAAPRLFFHFRLRTRCFDEYSNSTIESQNSALKTTSTGVKATDNIDQAARRINYQALQRAAARDARTAELQMKLPLYSKEPFPSHPTPLPISHVVVVLFTFFILFDSHVSRALSQRMQMEMPCVNCPCHSDIIFGCGVTWRHGWLSREWSQPPL
jgi:hypothetical protein